jgi:hypothetical protein
VVALLDKRDVLEMDIRLVLFLIVLESGEQLLPVLLDKLALMVFAGLEQEERVLNILDNGIRFHLPVQLDAGSFVLEKDYNLLEILKINSR